MLSGDTPEGAPALCRWAILDESWSKRLKAVGGEAGNYFTEHYAEVMADMDEPTAVPEGGDFPEPDEDDPDTDPPEW
jgi:hypothetical protein